jgi:hypothetical protein
VHLEMRNAHACGPAVALCSSVCTASCECFRRLGSPLPQLIEAGRDLPWLMLAIDTFVAARLTSPSIRLACSESAPSRRPAVETVLGQEGRLGIPREVLGIVPPDKRRVDGPSASEYGWLHCKKTAQAMNDHGPGWLL